MASMLNFDEVNRLGRKIVHHTPEPYEKYFGVMDIPKKEIDRRIKIAEELEEEICFMLDYLWLSIQYGYLEEKYAIPTIMAQYMKVTDKCNLPPEHVNYIYDFAVNLFESVKDCKIPQGIDRSITSHHNDKKNNGGVENSNDGTITVNGVKPEESGNENNPYFWLDPDTLYIFSDDRAIYNAENEAMNIVNAEEFEKARKTGKQSKTWKCRMDGKERTTHHMANGQTVLFDELFIVGGSQFRFPRDLMYNPSPSEYINCRCWCVYK